MKILLLIFTLCLISDGEASMEVTGYSGGGILINCKYIQKPLSFCKVSLVDCYVQIKAEAENMWVTSGRFSVFDDTKSAEFWVMIRELTVEDTGTYRCSRYKNPIVNLNKQLELKIKKGSSDSREVTAYAGTRSNIKCRYEDQYKDKPKSFWKIRTDQWSIKHINTETHSEWSHDGRFSIHDNRSAGFFSVFIRELIIEDTGTYACAVAASDQIEIYTVVQLNVTEGFSAIRLTALCVGLLVLLIGIIFVIVILYKRCKIQDRETMTQTSRKKNEDYENVRRLQSAQNTNPTEFVSYSLNPNTNQSDSVYQSLNPNTNQSDSVYQSLNPDTNQSDSVYQSLNPDTNQSDSIYQSLNPKTNQSD